MFIKNAQICQKTQFVNIWITVFKVQKVTSTEVWIYNQITNVFVPMTQKMNWSMWLLNNWNTTGDVQSNALEIKSAH